MFTKYLLNISGHSLANKSESMHNEIRTGSESNILFQFGAIKSPPHAENLCGDTLGRARSLTHHTSEGAGQKHWESGGSPRRQTAMKGHQRHPLGLK